MTYISDSIFFRSHLYSELDLGFREDFNHLCRVLIMDVVYSRGKTVTMVTALAVGDLSSKLGVRLN